MEDFLYSNSWFEKKHLIPENNRYWTFKIALNLFLQNKGKTIIETGTTSVGDLGAGASTIIFGEFCQRYGGQVYTIDIEPTFIQKCKEWTLLYKDHINYIIGDSLEFLKNFQGKIDLLYLDSFDFPLDGSDPTPCQQHQLKELEFAWPKLSEKGIILLDDNTVSGFPESGGKTRLSKGFLKDHKARLIMDYQQSLFIK